MKRLKSILAMILVFTAVLSVVAVPAYAVDFTTVTSGTTVALKNEGKCKYKLTLKSDSLVTVSWTGNKKGTASIDVYADKAMTKHICMFYLEGEAGSEKAVLAKGTYYVDMYDGVKTKATTKVTFSVKSQSKINKDNWNRSKAIALKANKWATILQTPNYDYPRWYKVTLTKAKTIKVYTRGNDYFRVFFYNSRGITLDEKETQTSTGYRYSTEEVLNPGVYYFRIDSGRHEYYGMYGKEGICLQVKWN